MNPDLVVPINDLSRWDEDEKIQISEHLAKLLDVGVFLNGPNVRMLESQIQIYLSGYQTVAVANGSDALYIALYALGLPKSRRVATVGNAGGYSTSSILRLGGQPVLIDIDPSTSQMSAGHLREVLSKGQPLDAVVVTHLYGLIGSLKELEEICNDFEIPMIEDCAQSFGAVADGRPGGAYGQSSAFSFYPTKNLAALGDGGMVAFKDSEACTRARKISQYGWSSRYEVELPDGINSRLDEIQAAVVLHRLNSVDSRNSRRRDILRRYAEAVTSPRRFIFEDSERCVAHLAVLRTPSRDRDRAVLRSFGIETAIHYPIPDHKQPAWRHLFEGVALPNTESHCAEVLTLPCFPELTEDEIARVCEVLGSL